MAEHALNGEMRLAGIGWAENSRNACTANTAAAAALGK
jgi:hypothetical protein